MLELSGVMSPANLWTRICARREKVCLYSESDVVQADITSRRAPSTPGHALGLTQHRSRHPSAGRHMAPKAIRGGVSTFQAANNSNVLQIGLCAIGERAEVRGNVNTSQAILMLSLLWSGPDQYGALAWVLENRKIKPSRGRR